MYHDDYVELTKKIRFSSEQMRSELCERLERPFLFRFVGGQQSVPFAVAYAKWKNGGEAGPKPMAPAAELRAAIYDQSETANQIVSFSRVTCVILLELVEALLKGISRQEISS